MLNFLFAMMLSLVSSNVLAETSLQTAPTSAKKYENAKPKQVWLDGAIWGALTVLEYSDRPTEGRAMPWQSFDESARDWIHGEERSPTFTTSEMMWRRYSDYSVLSLLGASVATPLLYSGSHARALVPVSRAFALNNLVTVSLKHVVRRSRPKVYSFDEVDQGGDNAFSFPSGHSSNAFAAATVLHALTPDAPKWLHAGLYVVAASTAIGRIKGDKHYLSDVLVGAVIGVTTARFAMADDDGSDMSTASLGSNALITTFSLAEF
jgi:hypothetical protein